MSASDMTKITLRAVITACLLSFAAAAQALPTLLGSNVTVSLLETGFPDASDTVTVTAAAEIVGNDPASNVGSLLFSDEFVDISALRIVYRIHGGGGAYAANPNYQLWGPTADDARLVFSGLNFQESGSFLADVLITMQDVVGLSLGANGVAFTGNSLTLNFGSLGILASTNIGTITLDLRVGHDSPPPNNVPEPGSLLLMVLGLFALFAARYAPGRRGAHSRR